MTLAQAHGEPSGAVEREDTWPGARIDPALREVGEDAPRHRRLRDAGRSCSRIRLGV